MKVDCCALSTAITKRYCTPINGCYHCIFSGQVGINQEILMIGKGKACCDKGCSVIILSTSPSPSLLVSSSDPETSRLSVCFSCASPAYLSLWNQLMHHYFPPKNFTDRCWGPDSEIGTVPCRGSCFILVEEIFEHCVTGPENQIVNPIHAYKQYSTMQGLLLPNEFDSLVSFVPNVSLLI
ncbi:hypothetical protein WUBG_05650 [Wuchereria bancrofti]|uniref:Uncharacterized protein n=1 Tax=Wuchereria bancrofti TaxID=6293 RepID=J9EML8_WUCBA|nr:hypothetical protein WUBG_05650 [Wuchereria bancrofti]